MATASKYNFCLYQAITSGKVLKINFALLETIENVRVLEISDIKDRFCFH